MIAATVALRRADPGALRQVICPRCDQVFLSDQPTYEDRFGEWVHEVCPAATEFRIGPDREGEAATYTLLKLPPDGPPYLPSPLASPELQLLRAHLDAIKAYGSESSWAGEAQFQSARRRIVARLEERLSREQEYDLPDEVRAQDAYQILGYWRKRRRGGDVFYPGSADLEPRQAEAIWLALDGLSVHQIARDMKPKRDGEQPATTSVDTWLSEGRRKLRALFQLPAEVVDG